MCKRCEVESRKREKHGTGTLIYEVWMNVSDRKALFDEWKVLNRSLTMQERHFIDNLKVMNENLEQFRRLGRAA